MTSSSTPPDGLPLAELLPLRSVVVCLRFLEASTPAFFHQPALCAFLRFLAGSPEGFERLIRFDAPESGRIAYRPGDHYRFNLIALSGGEAILQTLLHNLARLPGSSPRKDRRLPFRDNCELAALHDAFSAQPIGGYGELCAYDFDNLEQEAELWRGHNSLTWQFLSPTRVLKDKASRGETKGEARYCRNLPDVDGGLLSSRLYDSLSELLRARGATTSPRPPAPPMNVGSGHLFWLDAGYTDAEGKNQVMGGLSGRLELAFPEPPAVDWLQQAILGQYTGIGQRAAFGFGRYRLESPDGAFSLRRVLPAASLLARVREEANLCEAWRHIRANRLAHRPQPSVEEEFAGEWDGEGMENCGSEASFGYPLPNPSPRAGNAVELSSRSASLCRRIRVESTAAKGCRPTTRCHEPVNSTALPRAGEGLSLPSPAGTNLPGANLDSRRLARREDSRDGVLKRWPEEPAPGSIRGLDEGEEADTDEIPLERLQTALDRALNSDYRPPPLYGRILPQPGGGVRPLAVPPFFDRVLQRAVAQVIGPALELTQYRHSYGFRAGRSRLNARDAIQTAIREGYGWVYESDVDDFFDSVDPHRLEVRLRSLYGEDPIVDLVLAWMTCPADSQAIGQQCSPTFCHHDFG